MDWITRPCGTMCSSMPLHTRSSEHTHTHSLTHTHTHLHIHSFSLTHLHIHSLTHSLAYLPIYSLTHQPTHSPLTHPLTHSLTPLKMALYELSQSSFYVAEANHLIELANAIGQPGITSHLAGRADDMRTLITTHLWDEEGQVGGDSVCVCVLEGQMGGDSVCVRAFCVRI